MNMSVVEDTMPSLSSEAAVESDDVPDEAVDEVNYKEDMFCWAIEGVCILIIGLIGMLGNSCSMVLFSKQKVHRIFHHLLLLLSCFDMVRKNKTENAFSPLPARTCKASNAADMNAPVCHYKTALSRLQVYRPGLRAEIYADALESR
jgi:hypothetical protein